MKIPEVCSFEKLHISLFMLFLIISNPRYSPPSEQTYRVQVCSRNTSTTGYSIITGTDRVTDNMIPATLIDQSCDVSDISVVRKTWYSFIKVRFKELLFY